MPCAVLADTRGANRFLIREEEHQSKGLEVTVESLRPVSVTEDGALIKGVHVRGIHGHHLLSSKSNGAYILMDGWHTQLSSGNGGGFFNEVFGHHPNILCMPSALFETEKLNYS